MVFVSTMLETVVVASGHPPKHITVSPAVCAEAQLQAIVVEATVQLVVVCTNEIGTVAVLVKFAVTVVALLSVTTQVPVPEHGADHPPNEEFNPAAAVRVTIAP